MTAPVRVLPFGQHALLVELAGLPEVHRLWRALWDARDAGDPALRAVEEIVPGARTVLIVGRPGQLDLAGLGHELPGRAARAGPVRGAGPGGPAELVVPVVYDGPDLDEVASLTGLSPAGVVERHSRAAYTVAFLGFAPGFAYLDGLDPGLAVPRREQPRPAVPAGSVAVAGAMSAVYPAAMPGGWQLIGRTGTVLFDPARTPPALLGPGDRVRFNPVDRLPVPPPGGGAGATGGPPGAGPGPVVEVLRPGPRTTVQDRGRVGHGHEGVPRAGAVDAPSLAVANELVGNPPGSAALETTLAGPALRFPGGALVAVAGADAPATIDGVPVAARPAPVPPGGVLDVGTARRGLRCYIAVAGGLAVPAVLGSRSADTLSRLGPPPLRRGDVLPLGLPLRPPAPEAPTRAAPPAALPGVADEVEVLVHPGPRADRLGPGGLTGLGRLDLRVSPVSDRTGLRLEGDALPPPAGEPLPSEGMVPGAVQLPPGGHPIVLLCNHAVTGGYPVVAVVADRDLPVLAQSRPGTRVRLRPVG